MTRLRVALALVAVLVLQAAAMTAPAGASLRPASTGERVLEGFYFKSLSSTSELFPSTQIATAVAEVHALLLAGQRSFGTNGYTDVRCNPANYPYFTNPCVVRADGTTLGNSFLSRQRAITLRDLVIVRFSATDQATLRAGWVATGHGEKYARATVSQCRNAPDRDPCYRDRHADVVLRTVPATTTTTTTTPPTTTTTTTLPPPPPPPSSITTELTLTAPTWARTGANEQLSVSYAVSCGRSSIPDGTCGESPSSTASNSGVLGPYVTRFDLGSSGAWVTPPSGYPASAYTVTYPSRCTSPCAGASLIGQPLALTARFTRATDPGSWFYLRATAFVTVEWKPWQRYGNGQVVWGATQTENRVLPLRQAPIGVLGTSLG